MAFIKSGKGGAFSRPASGGSSKGGFFNGLGDVAGNFLGDVKSAALGLPAGLVMAAEHPIRAAKATVNGTWHDWSPLFHGHFGEWGHNFMAHPLAPILDVASVITLGGAGEAKIAAALGKTPELERAVTGLTDATGRYHPTVYKDYHSNPVIRVRQQALEGLSNQLGAHMPKWFGHGGVVRDMTESGRQGRLLNYDRSMRRAAVGAARDAQMAAFFKASKDVTQNPLEVAQMFENHAVPQLINHAYWTPESALRNTKLAKEWSYLDAQKVNHIHQVGVHVNTPEALAAHLKSFGTRYLKKDTTRKGALSRINPQTGEREFAIVSRQSVKDYGAEGANSTHALAKLYNGTTEMWKWLTLATAPRYFVNNAVGNSFMYLAKHGGVRGFRGIVDAVRQVKGERAARASLSKAEQHVAKLYGGGVGGWQDRWYLGSHRGHAADMMSTIKTNTGGPVRIALAKGQSGLYPLTHKVSDTFLRRATINEVIRKQPEYRLLRQRGFDHNQAADLASQSQKVRVRVQRETDKTLGNYTQLSPFERGVRKIIPFYTWDRAILQHGLHLADENPGRVDLASKQGQQGAQETTKLLGGNIPDFLQSSLPLSLLGRHGKGGRDLTLSTVGINPYATLPDIATAGTSALKLATGHNVGGVRLGESLSQQINPLITGVVEEATGQSLLSGAKIKTDHGILGNTVSSTPWGNLINAAINGPPHTKSTPLYNKDVKQYLGALLGYPEKALDEGAASKLADTQKGVKKSKKKKGVF